MSGNIELVEVFPAYAGMIPYKVNVDTLNVRVPRIRGDDPNIGLAIDPIQRVFPAYAGMIPAGSERPVRDVGVPRIRGDDPV